MRLTDIAYGPDGTMTYTRHDATAGEDELAGYLATARQILDAAGDLDLSGHAAEVSTDFDHLRWFDLPEVCCP